MSTRQTTHDTPIESARIGPDDPRYRAVVDKRCMGGMLGLATYGGRINSIAQRSCVVKHARPGQVRFALVTAATVLAVLLFSPRFTSAQSTVSIRTADGGVVIADVYGSGDRGVVLAHGGRFDRTSWREQARELASAGFRVVAIDFRAAAEARAGRDSACLYDPVCLAKDVLAAIRYLREAGAGTVSLVGGSLGGGAVAEATAEAGRGTIDRLVLLAHMPIDRPERMQGRKLFILSRDDRRSGDTPRLPEIQAQFEKAPPPKELVVLDGSAHAQFIFQTDQGARLMREILRFLTAP